MDEKARIRIEDLPENLQVSDEDLKRVQGGFDLKLVVGTVWYKIGSTLGMLEGSGDDGGTQNAVAGVRG